METALCLEQHNNLDQTDKNQTNEQQQQQQNPTKPKQCIFYNPADGAMMQ